MSFGTLTFKLRNVELFFPGKENVSVLALGRIYQAV